MYSKRFSLLLISILLFSFMFVGTVFAQNESEVIDPKIPEAWFEAPKTASEMGITEFKQSPMLDDEVSDGKFPSVKERLPDDPPVREVYENIGDYGGEAVVWDRQFNYYETGYWNNVGEANPTPDGNLIPFYVKDWEFSDDYKNFTLYLYEGLKWSDGEPFTSEDYIYWWENEANNETLEPVPPEEWKPSLLDVTSDGKWEVTFHYGRPVPQRPSNFKWFWHCSPKHYMKQFHPDFVGMDKVKEMASEVGLENWEEFYLRVQEDSPAHPEYNYQRPVLSPYVFVARTETYTLMERNPYYPFVDPEGNQLPYVDRVRVNLANSSEMARSKAATGEATLAARHPQAEQIPLYKQNEKKGDFETYIYPITYGGITNIQVNLSHENPELRELFLDLRLRKALSFAIDRENINEKVFYGQAKVSQATIPRVSSSWKQEYAQSFIEFDQEKAKNLLEEMGMVDTNEDGFRERPNGEDFNPTLIYAKMGAVDPTKTLELIRKNFEEIGIDIDLKKVSRELHDTRRAANNWEMSVWTGAASVMFGANLPTVRNYAPVSGPQWEPWPAYINWYTSNGSSGMEPPENIKKLIDYAETAVYSIDEEERMAAKDKLLKAQAENLWMIGTVNLAPQPIIVNNKLKNVPKYAPWDYMLGYFSPYNSEQFYLEGAEPIENDHY